MSWLNDKARAEMKAITANISHVRLASATTKFLRYDKENKEIVEHERPAIVEGHSMFPYKSTAMCVDPSEVPEVADSLRKQGIFVEFDREGRPIIESTKQQSDLAKAFGMKTGRDGYGHVDEFGNFHNSGRRRTEEMQRGREKVRKAINELNTMPEDSHPNAVADVLREYDIAPCDENTG